MREPVPERVPVPEPEPVTVTVTVPEPAVPVTERALVPEPVPASGEPALTPDESVPVDAWEHQCTVCLEDPACVAIFPCGHNAFCGPCSIEFMKNYGICPLCRGPCYRIAKWAHCERCVQCLAPVTHLLSCGCFKYCERCASSAVGRQYCTSCGTGSGRYPLEARRLI